MPPPPPAAWHGHTEHMTQAVYVQLTSKTRSDTGQNAFSKWS